MSILTFVLFVGAAIAILAAVITLWPKNDPVAEDAGFEPFTAVRIALAFDPDNAMLWDTQVPALELVSSAGRLGLSIQRLKGIYNESARHYPELYEGSGFRQWVDFLEQVQLIALNRERFVLTPKGLDFLRYRIAGGPNAAMRWAAEDKNGSLETNGSKDYDDSMTWEIVLE
jgi:hypothetical protein